MGKAFVAILDYNNLVGHKMVPIESEGARGYNNSLLLPCGGSDPVAGLSRKRRGYHVWAIQAFRDSAVYHIPTIHSGLAYIHPEKSQAQRWVVHRCLLVYSDGNHATDSTVQKPLGCDCSEHLWLRCRRCYLDCGNVPYWVT